MGSSSYYTMLVCENGHVITDCLERSTCDDKFCDKCGAPTISSCPTCGAKIRGDRKDSGIFVVGYVTPAPKYCPECGAPFPWTIAAIESLKELAELDDGLSDEDANELAKSAEETLSETPKTKVAAIKVKKILARAGRETASAARDLLVDVMAETAKRVIWPS
jgi:hypothetical protein